MSEQTVLRFPVSLRGTLSNSLTFTMIIKYGKGAVIKIESVFGPVYHVACRGVLWNATFYAFI